MINLLPPQYKTELIKEERWKLVLILGTLFFFSLLSFILILFAVKIYIQGQKEFLKIMADSEEKILQNEKNKSLFEKIDSANQNLSKLNDFYKNRTDSIIVFEKISETLPSGIHLTDFSWQKNISQIILSGSASNRETLFEFKNNLESQKEFKEINFPAESWIKPVDIDFRATLRFKNELQ